MANRVIWKRRVQSFKEWIRKSWGVNFTFASFRWLVDHLFIVDLGIFIESGTAGTWASWVTPLFITEIILQWNKTHKQKQNTHTAFCQTVTRKSI